MMRRSVDLPPPLGPRSAVSCPVGMLTSTSSSATKSPKRLLTWETSMLTGPLPGADEGHDDDAGHRDEGQEERRSVGAALVEVQVLLLDDESGRPGVAQDVARHDLDAPNSPSERARLSTTP